MKKLLILTFLIQAIFSSNLFAKSYKLYFEKEAEPFVHVKINNIPVKLKIVLSSPGVVIVNTDIAKNANLKSNPLLPVSAIMDGGSDPVQRLIHKNSKRNIKIGIKTLAGFLEEKCAEVLEYVIDKNSDEGAQEDVAEESDLPCLTYLRMHLTRSNWGLKIINQTTTSVLSVLSEISMPVFCCLARSALLGQPQMQTQWT